MFGLPSLKTTGIVVAIVAVLTYLFRDNPLIQGLLSALGMGGEAQAGEKPPATNPASGAQGAPQQQLPPQERAVQVMTELKQRMELQGTPEPVRQAILAKEPELMQKLAQVAGDPVKEQQVQLIALSEATKPQFDTFVAKAQKQVTDQMDKMIREVTANGNLPANEKKEMLKNLRSEKENLVNSLKGEFEKMPLEKRVSLALNSEIQNNILKGQSERLGARGEELDKSLSGAARHNSGWAWGSSILGWTAAVAGVASFIPVVNVVAFPVACAAGIGAGACKIVNNVGKGGSTTELTVGIIEAGLSAAPPLMLASKSVGLIAKSAEFATTGGKIGGFSKWCAASFKNMIGWGDDASHALTESVSIAHGQMLNSVKAASKVEAVSDAINAGSIGDDMAKIQDAVLGYIKTGNKVSITENRYAQKLVDEAIHHHYWNDPIKGVIPSGVRGFIMAGANEVDNIVPSQTPQHHPAKAAAPAKTTTAF